MTRKKVYQATILAMTYALVYGLEEGACKISESTIVQDAQVR